MEANIQKKEQPRYQYHKVKHSPGKKIKKHWQLYLLILLPLLYIVIFHYIPMYGVQIAFKDFNVREGITGSPWVGMKHLTRFVTSYNFWRILENNILLSVYGLIAGFPVPIVLALVLNELGNEKYKKTVQMFTYAPYFISTVVIVSMIIQFLSPRIGMINLLLGQFGVENINFMAQPDYFRHIYVWSGVWQGAGYGAIIYLAVLSSIDPSLHEAAIVDGATKLQRIAHINIPGIIPTATILLILNLGQVMSIGFEKAFLMQNSLNIRTSEIIATYVYKMGIIDANFSYAASIGLFNSVINLILLVTVNQIARRYSETSLW